MNNKQNIDWDLAAKVYAGEASKTELSVFRKWLGEDNHKEDWSEVIASLSQVDYSLVKQHVNVSQAWHRVSNKALGAHRRKISWLYMASAAAVACFIVIVLTFLNPFQKSQSIMVKSKDGIEKIDLDDGSIIDLNRNSSVEYPLAFGKNTRFVSLEGEAFFEIAADTSRPFVIYTHQIQIKVLGTSFNVKALSNSAINEVSVNAGVVEVSSLLDTQNKVLLKTGDRAVFNAKNHSWVKRQVLNRNYMAWKTKEFAFKRDRLTEAIALIEEVYDVSIEVPKDFDAEGHVISSTFDRYDIEHIVLVLSELYGVDFGYREN